MDIWTILIVIVVAVIISKLLKAGAKIIGWIICIGLAVMALQYFGIM